MLLIFFLAKVMAEAVNILQIFKIKTFEKTLEYSYTNYTFNFNTKNTVSFEYIKWDCYTWFW